MSTFPFGAALLSSPSWFIDLDQVHSSYLLLATLVALGLAAGVLFRVGLMGWLFRALGFVIGAGIRRGFLLWERLLSWASWPRFLAVVLGFLVVGGAAGNLLPILRVFFGLIPLLMGATACLAYMFIDLERYEVERGHKAIHNPLLGQALAVNLARHGQQVRVPLLIAATVALIGGFALLNQGLYETIGQDWYRVEAGPGGPIYADFLAYGLINLLGIVPMLDLAEAHHLHFAHVHQAAWPATALLAGFRAFFTLVLLQQFFASLRQGKLLAETIADFWSPHEPISERARNALPQYGALAIEPLLLSIRSATSLTREQRDQLPLILATIGPSTIPALVRDLRDEHVHVRAIAVAALGRLHAVDTVPLLVALARDPSDVVRQNLIEALGTLGSAGTRPAGPKRGHGRRLGWRGRGIGWLLGWKTGGVPASLSNPVDLAVATLQSALADDSVAVRTQAALALGRIGPPAAAVAPELIALLKDADETVRCQAAEALGQVGGEGAAAVAALVELLPDASAPVKAAAARALGALKTAAAPAVPSLVPLLQDRDESVRTAAAEAIAQVGSLNGAATETLIEGLTSPDNIVRAQTAEALGTIGAGAEEAAPALVKAMKDDNDRVRAKAVEALGKIGESAAGAAVPGLVRALRDQDNWVSALAAEALGQMGESADGAIPALVRALGHPNPQVRGNAAEALGKMGAAAAGARPALEKAFRDADGAVRSQATRALGMIGGSTPASEQIILAALQDADPLVRTAAVESVGLWGEPSAAALRSLAALLDDANDQVKVEAIRVLPRLAGATPDVIDALCRRLLDDDSAWVQVHAALALGQLGAAAAVAGGPLLCAVQTGEVSVREQSLRAIAMIQPPEILAAFTAGLQDANGDIRKVASGGWMKAASIPEAIIPVLVVALSDPEAQVRANAAHALARLDSLPAEAIPLLVACTADPSDGLRMTAAMALKAAPAGATGEAMRHLLEDANVRIRLIAASSLLAADPGDARARVVLVEALGDPSLRVRKAALELVESLGTNGVAFLEVLKERAGLEEDAELRDALGGIIERLGNQPGSPAARACEGRPNSLDSIHAPA
ncbi:MAG TPA: HEAT repeat domain-containing protein [Gemmataceae bacterium]|nr:HEAT repeat domain-containing protein [Gemmataceae bacterium]